MKNSRPKVCFVVATEMSITVFLLGHLQALSTLYDITVITNTNTPDFLDARNISAHVIPLNIQRRIHLVNDFKTLIQLFIIFRNHQFDAVHSLTPKAGLLSMLAATLNKIPLRIHTFTGQVWANKTGLKRWLLKKIDTFFGYLSTHCIIDSPSQRDFLINEKVLSSNKCFVFNDGSISGVDISKFQSNQEVRLNTRETLNISSTDTLFLFLGRLNHDKGVLDLAQAFMNAGLDKATLLFVGPDEQGMQAKIKVLAEEEHPSSIMFIDYTSRPQDYMAAADVLCLPSYREGFGSVIIEAAACGTTALASRIYGITDAVIDQETGLLHSPKDIEDIKAKLVVLHEDTALRRQLGKQAFERAKSEFNHTVITDAWCHFYHGLLGHQHD